ncbi:MAG: leucyl aminopeptidase family protein [Deltaproteobacteria bacterium]|nr:leucyl aminopeptidase family protein [Deltaproteobacteria bacterium]
MKVDMFRQDLVLPVSQRYQNFEEPTVLVLVAKKHDELHHIAVKYLTRSISDQIAKTSADVAPIYLSKNLLVLAVISKSDLRDQLEQGAKVYEASKFFDSQNFVFLGNAAPIDPFVEGFLLSLYKKNEDFEKVIKSLKSKKIFANSSNPSFLSKRLFWTFYIKWLTDLPSNICTPGFFSEQARLWAGKLKLNCKILSKPELRRTGFNGILAVAGDQDAFAVTVEYKSKESKFDLALVGKGLTFDTGGICLKPADGMSAMKADMAGAALALGVVCLSKVLNLPVNITSYLGITCNAVSQNSYKPGDMIRMKNGQKVIVENTDAEGRLVLADLISYAVEQGKKNIITLATLTGGIRIGLGLYHAGLFCNDAQLASKLLQAGEMSGEQLCQLPLEPKYAEELRIDNDTISNIGSTKSASPIIGAMFLKNFIPEGVKFAHLDIAGVAYHHKTLLQHWGKGATGWGLRLFTNFLNAL